MITVIEKLINKANFDFNNAVVELEALSNYYIQTRDSIQQSEIEYDKKYRISLEIAELFDQLYEKNPEDRKTYLEELSNTKLSNNLLLKDVMNISLTEDSEKIQYSLIHGPTRTEHDPRKARTKKKYLRNQKHIFTRSILSNVIVSFEQYLSNYYETLMLNQPKAYLEDKKIRAIDIIELDFSDILQNLIHKEVEANMFDSLKLLNKIKDKSGIEMDRYIKVRDEFEEIYYRRNAYIHTNGCVNAIYLENVTEKYKKGKSVGDELICDDIYLDNAIIVAYKIISSLHYELLRCMEADQDEYDNSLAILGFSAMQEENYSLSEFVYGILRRHRELEYRYKAIYEVNYLNSLKLQGKNISDLLSKFDVSIATDEFKIAKECLLGNDEKIYKMLTASYPNSFDAVTIREWPIFVKFRESEYYAKFVEEHIDDFEKFDFEEQIDTCKESYEIES